MSVASLLHLGLISVDRYLAICKPLQYRSSVTMNKVVILIGFTWLFSFAFGFGVIFSKMNLVGMEEIIAMNSCVGTCFLFFNKQGGITAAFVGFFIPGTVMTALYLKIFYVARGQARLINDSLAMTTAPHDKRNCTFDHREKKAAKTLGIIFYVARMHARKINDSLAVTGTLNDHKNRITEEREKKAAKTLGFVMG
ncbi:hypothetical protein JZ751_005031, partial [Albula glossodonta]